MKEVRILFTGVGRRIELVQAFREAALILNINLKIYGADMAGTAPALVYCDYTRKVCGMKDANYISELVQICENDKIDLLIPTIDTDLLVLSKNTDAFKNTKVLISNPDKILVCRDKNNTSEFFEGCGCKAPKTFNDWKKYDGEFPCFIKPKDGSSSVNAFKVENIEELEMYAQQVEDYIIQNYIEGTEYTVDVFCDINGQPIYIVPRIRLQVRAGEVLKTQIVLDETIIEECKRIIEKFKPVGPMTIQLIRKNDTQEDYYIEINPRFGGGAPLSMKAGAKSAEVLLRQLIGDDSNSNGMISDGAVYSRFDQSVCIQNKMNSQPIKGVIFDLDDTLYSEKEYVKSGYQAIESYLKIKNVANDLWQYFEAKESAIDRYLEQINKMDLKGECLKVYREHEPSIHLYEGVREKIIELKDKGIKVGIITDGRPSGQRKKIKALGLDEIIDDIIITDELGGEQFRKPCDIAFRIMQRKWRLPFEQMMYVGDNIHKDFQAPKQLGMQRKYIKNQEGLY